MKSRAWLFGILLALSLLGSSAPTLPYPYPPFSSREARFMEALGELGLTRDQVGLDPLYLGYFAGDRFRTWTFDLLSREPWRTPAFLEEVERGLGRSEEGISVSRLMMSVHARQSVAIRRGLIGDELDPYREELDRQDDPIAYTLRQVGSPGLTSHQRKVLTSYPEDVVRALLIFLLVVDDAYPFYRSALGGLDPTRLAYLCRGAVSDDDLNSLSPAEEVELEEAYARFDFRLMNTGSTLIATATDHLDRVLTSNRPALEKAPGIAFATRYGYVVLDSGGELAVSDEVDYRGFWPPSPSYLTLLRVTLPAPREKARSLAASYDEGSLDRLNPPPSPAVDPQRFFVQVHLSLDERSEIYQGKYLSLIPGTTILIDHGGNDRYLDGDHFPGRAASCFGTSVVVDYGGDDTYVGDRVTQGAGFFGFGVLADLAGNDRYEAFSYAQGFGYVGGSGLLYDREGDDTYECRDDEIRYPSPQSQEHNASLCQGFGYGKRSDYLIGHSLAGGVGILIEGAGNDRYLVGVFGQGAGYWYGVGLLYDKAGNDRYLGQWYVQGAAAHFAVGALYDGAGDDSYTAPMNMALGAGHDLSLGLLYEAGGDDTYQAPNLSLGASNAMGIGIFWEEAGNDTYRAKPGTNFGEANRWKRGGVRRFMPAVGVFLDLSGVDTYPTGEGFEYLGNGKQWDQNQREKLTEPRPEIGRGLDR